MCKILSDLKLHIYKRLVRFQLNVALDTRTGWDLADVRFASYRT